MDKLINFLLVGLGGALGSMLRYGVTLLFASMGWSGNLATMSVNIAGSLAIGYLSGSIDSQGALLLMTVGLCGGFTTFSTFSLQSVKLLQTGRIGEFALYVLVSVIVCIAMAWLGYSLAKRF